MKKRLNISKLVLILIIPILICSISFYIAVFNEGYYIKQFEKNNIYQQFDLNKTQLHEINHILLEYLDKGEGEIDTSSVESRFFNEKEIVHLLEVRHLFKSFFLLFYFFLTIFILLNIIVYLRNRKRFIRNLIITLISGGILNIVSILILCVGIFTNFSNSFTKFHLVLFESDTWILNPATDNLIKMFPQQFFYDICFRIFSNSIIISIILILILLYIYRTYKKTQETTA